MVPVPVTGVSALADDMLALVADEHDARTTVVGTHRPGLVHWMSQVVASSVAGRLAHTQRRPVLLVPAPLHGVRRSAA